MVQEIVARISNAISEFNTDLATKLVRQAIGEKISPLDVIMKGVVPGLEAVGQKYEYGEYFMAELVAGGTTAKACLDILEPMLKAGDQAARGVVVIGTVQGDLHDIGKNLVAVMLLGQGFRVVDLGTDVPAGKFIETIQKQNPRILALSCLLTTTMPRLPEVLEETEKAGVRDKIKVMVGGRALTPEYARSIGADAYAADAVEAARVARNFVA